MSCRKICVVVFSRANYGSIKSLIRELSNDKFFNLKIISGGSALLNKYGNCASIIKKDGFKISENLYFVVEGETTETMVKSTAVAMIELSSVFNKLKPDVVFTVGDRYETMATVLTAAYMNIPIAHTMGGEISGTIDESIRHGITKFAHLHFPATKKAKKNIIRLGEKKSTVFNVGCPRIDIVKESLNKKINDLNEKVFINGVGEKFDILNKNFIIVMQHPVTTEYNDSSFQIRNTLAAVEKIKLKKLFFWPNSDAGSEKISREIRIWRERNIGNKDFFFIKNLESHIFYKTLSYARCLVGNSSVGIREAGYVGIPVVNIGTRQQGREHGKNVLNSSYKTIDIYNKIFLSIKKKTLIKKDFTYGDGNAAIRIKNILKKIKKISIQKKLNY
jgi:UDP-hydrolysing UDP-N-acetyl-D-glucosamine 2-epimerase